MVAKSIANVSRVFSLLYNLLSLFGRVSPVVYERVVLRRTGELCRGVFELGDEHLHSLLVHGDKGLFLPGEAVHLPRVHVEPQRVDVRPSVSEALVHEGVGGHVLHLHQRVNHRDLVRDAEFLVDVNVGGELLIRVLCVK